MQDKSNRENSVTSPRSDEDHGTDPAPQKLELAEVRHRLSRAKGPEFWRSLDELAQTPEFEELLHREFPRQAAELPEGVSRRGFLHLMGASLALGGLTACTRQPLERIVPYVEQPESLVPGRPLYFASSMPLDGYARPLLVESHMGRPTKVEGNPEHPASSGATDLFAQASVLNLYDPERSQVVMHNGRISTWSIFVEEFRNTVQALSALGEARIRVLTRTVTSPSQAALIREVLEDHSGARWHQYTPVTRDTERQGMESAFGRPLSVRYDLSQAEVILSLDSDFLTAGPGALRYARDFAGRRRAGNSPMNRLYIVESSPTSTGTLADHRLPVRASEIGAVATALATELGVQGAAAQGDPIEGDRTAWITAVARDLSANRGRCAVIPGDYASEEVHVLAHAINEHLANIGSTVILAEPLEERPETETESIRQLAQDMAAGDVDLLLVLGCNPVYEAPADLEFRAAMGEVGYRVHLGLYQDETAEYCHWHIPEAHYLESWGDSRSFDGGICLTQPLIEPLYGGKAITEILSLLTGGGERGSLDLLTDYWIQKAGAESFETTWRKWLHGGFVSDQQSPPVAVSVSQDAVAKACQPIAEPSDSALEIIFRPDPTIHDGTFNNNGWLQECPKPLTKLTWDNAAVVGPALAQREGLVNEQVIELSVGDQSIELPVWVQPGHPDGCLTLHLGYGRERVGRVGTGTGFDASRLRDSHSPWLATEVRIQKTDRTHPLASTQLHSNIELESEEAEKRHLVRVGTLELFEQEPDFAQHMGHAPSPDLSLFPSLEYEGNAWGMSVDLNACTGCNACVIACQAENNIPIVGKEMVAMGREMHWIRIDRYFEGDLDEPHVHHQPVMCMHCEKAPCEVVCPVQATVHSDEGLNDMVYNRCVGTRYCSNNCPYKVRRFNFFKYNDTESPVLKMLRNPDVTVRTRGVMEKCTYCVQRINHGRIEAKKQGREIYDGEVKTACQQVCPTEAIVFGNINDPEAAVTKSKASPLSYNILAELGTVPRTSYLAKLRNPNHDLEKARDESH
jgi:molybdopterin-containing oxidoreductase family iron-sulfur binding subunit